MVTHDLPREAAWRHVGDQEGFEVAFLRRTSQGHVLAGSTTAVEDGVAWRADHEVDVADDWTTRSARVTVRTAASNRAVSLVADGAGAWWVDGVRRPDLDGCLDVDLESSVVTNTLPLHRLVGEGGRRSCPAAFVRVPGLAVERLEQTYERVGESSVDYRAPVVEVGCRITHDDHLLVRDYPGLATRVL